MKLFSLFKRKARSMPEPPWLYTSAGAIACRPLCAEKMSPDAAFLIAFAVECEMLARQVEDFKIKADVTSYWLHDALDEIAYTARVNAFLTDRDRELQREDE